MICLPSTQHQGFHQRTYPLTKYALERRDRHQKIWASSCPSQGSCDASARCKVVAGRCVNRILTLPASSTPPLPLPPRQRASSRVHYYRHYLAAPPRPQQSLARANLNSRICSLKSQLPNLFAHNLCSRRSPTRLTMLPDQAKPRQCSERPAGQ